MARSGFSLVELSIVLVILGLLTGGILAGQSLIRAAELRSVATESQRYMAALNSFRDKYFALPGDMANATAFWGAQNATPATCHGAQGPENRAIRTMSGCPKSCSSRPPLRQLSPISRNLWTSGRRFMIWQMHRGKRS